MCDLLSVTIQFISKVIQLSNCLKETKLGKKLCSIPALSIQSQTFALLLFPGWEKRNIICIGIDTPEHWRQEEIESELQKLAESVSEFLTVSSCGTVVQSLTTSPREKRSRNT